MSFESLAFELFPDLSDEALESVLYARNPEIPDDVATLLDEVSCATGVPAAWLQKYAKLVLDGLAGCQCLWYLHGMSGQITLDKYQEPHELKKLEDAEVVRLVKKGRKSGYTPFAIFVHANWQTGVTQEVYYDNGEAWERQAPTKVREMKLGKWLERVGASSDLCHAFATRQLPIWNWKISAHPFDVLTMSHNRPWTSCMRPGGAAERGPLTDMAAGSAIMFFYRPGAAKPCGRMVLRPGLSGPDPIVLSGKTIYGSGPVRIKEDQLNSMISSESLPVVYELPICQLGMDYDALTRFIYSDVEREYCEQDQRLYDLAYEALRDAPWPEPALDFGDMRNRVGALEPLAGATEYRGLDDVAREIANVWVGQANSSLISIIEYWKDGGESIPSGVDIEYAESAGLSEDDLENLPSSVNDVFEEVVENLLGSRYGTVVLVLSSGDRSVVFTIENELEYYANDNLEGLQMYSAYADWMRIPVDLRDRMNTDYKRIQGIVAFPDISETSGIESTMIELGFEIERLYFNPGEYPWDEWRTW